MSAEISSTVLKRDRLIALAALAAITTLAWVYMIHLTSGMVGMQEMSMPAMQTWQAADAWLAFLMWTVMMAAMMIPSVTPMILTFVGASRRRYPDRTSIPGMLTFLLGYLIAWGLFGAAATLVQWRLQIAALLSSQMIASINPFLSGALLTLAGIYQFTPLKNKCLSSCRTPLGFLFAEWREGTTGALRMGVRHGLYCVGCCWPLMLLLFALGVMNLLWSAILTGIVLIEKIVPGGYWFSRLVGLLSLGWGAWFLVQALRM